MMSVEDIMRVWNLDLSTAQNWYDAWNIKDKLKFYDSVKMECFNREEVEEIKSLLTEEERKRVSFTWLDFHEPEQKSRPKELS